MGAHLPPLIALRAFESAARQMSFRKAAAELNVTPAAISHQIRLLEDHLGEPLFRRLTRAVELTVIGQLLLPKLSEGFESLARAIEQVRDHQEAGALAVSAPPSFTAKWLMPRLHRFATAHPAIDVRVSASLRLIDTQRAGAPSGEIGAGERSHDADIEIHFGFGKYPNCRVDKLFNLSFTPMCSPGLMEGRRPLRQPADLRYHLLLHDDLSKVAEGWPDWDQWLAIAGAEDVPTDGGHSFSDPMLGLEAAIDGMGVVLGARELAARSLSAGRLVMPFKQILELGSGYFLVTAKTSAERPKISVFREWLLDEARGVRAGT